MTMVTAAFIITFLLALALALVTTPLAIFLSRKLGIIAQAGGRRQTEGDYRGVPKHGGLAIFLSFTLAVIAAQYLMVPRMDPNEPFRLTGLLLGGVLIYVVGLLDDLLELSALPLLLAQVAAAAVAIRFDIFIEYFNNPLSGQQTDPWPFAVTFVLSLFWIAGITNTVNFLDGLDGLAIGVVFITALTLFINSAFILDPPQVSVSLLPLALMGACLGYLVYNFYPAKIFLGGGAYYLGYVIACLSIIGGAKMATILMVLGLPLLDSAWQIGNRILQGRSPFSGDRGHLHFRLLDVGFSQRQIVLSYYAFCAIFGMMTLVLESQLFKFIAFGMMTVLVLVGFALIVTMHQRQRREEEQRGLG